MADIRTKDAEDFAAAIFLQFTGSGLCRAHRPTRSDVWTNARVAEGEIVLALRHAGHIVLQAGEGKLGQWVKKRRNTVDDYRRIVGEGPPERVAASWIIPAHAA